MSVLSRWRSDALWALSDQVLVSACTFLTTLLVARLVSVEAFSVFGLSVTVTLFVSAMYRSYLTQPMSVLGVSDGGDALTLRFRAVVVLHLLLWPLVCVGVAALGWRYFPDQGLTLAVLGYLLAYLLQEAVRRLCFTTSSIRLAWLMDMVAYGGYLGSLLAMVWCDVTMSVQGILWIGAAWFLISCAIGWQASGDTGSSHQWPTWSAVRAIAREHWDHSKWVCGSQVFLFGSFMLVPFQIAEFGSVLWVAHYNAANSILNVLNILRQTMGNYLPIVATRIYHERGFEAFRQALNRLSVAVLLASACMVLILVVFGEFLVSILYGARYMPVAEILPMAAIGPLVAMLSFVTQAGGLALGRTEQIFHAYLAGTICSVVLAPLLIPRFGLSGAIWVANVGYIVPTAWHWVMFRRDCREVASLKGA